MASSSSSAASSHSPKKYDVFISFRGEDTRFNFTSHVLDAFCRNHIETYIDYRLEKGDVVWPSLEKAIEDSTLFIVIFSENYASSTWCLRELTKILECTKDQGHLVMPVFYKIDPSHVRKQSGSYQIAFAEHEPYNKKQQVHKWREALIQAANFAGWHCSYDRNEAELIGEIVKCVIGKLDRMYHSEDHLKNLIGIQEKIADVESLLNKGSHDVRFIGIWGMGGIGKTTLAKAVFHKLCFAYEGFCFLANVREESKKHGITALKKKLISTLLGDKESHIGMPDGISPYAMRRLGRKKVIIVLDDVDDQEQLENLVGRHDWFGSGSRILITTRDKHVLREVDDIYKVEALNFLKAFHLFSLNAFKNDCANLELRELAKNVTYYANGIPLALQVLGSFLCGKSHEEWKSQLDKLKKMPYKKINDVLKLSFEGLDQEEKNIFLDIACIFKGNNVEDIKSLLDGCDYSTIIGLKSLEDKTLLTVSEKEVSMHDLIQEMGRKIVCEESLKNPGKRSRLWNSNEISQVLNDNMGTEAIEGITLNVSKIDEMHLSPQAFCSMPNLKFLDFHTNFNEQVSRLHFPCGLEFLPNKLRLLRWKGYPLKSLPATFSAENLVTIEMRDSKLTKLWDGDQNLVNLRKIDLSDSKYLIELPDFSKAIRLKEVDLSSCYNLRSVHPSILSLHSLNRLSLRSCQALTSLTSNTHLKSLSLLYLDGCSRLRKFSVTSENLRDLSLSGTNIESLPVSIKHLSSLQRLTLTECKRLRSLPELPPSNLQLYAENCTSLETLQLTYTTAEEEGLFLCFCFENCMKLDQQSIKAVETKALLVMNKGICRGVTLVYPGSKVPEWFMYRTTESSIVVDLFSIPQHKDWGCIFCVVVSKLRHGAFIDITWLINGQSVANSRFPVGCTFSDHVCLLYASQVQGINKKNETVDQNTTYHPSVEIEFKVNMDTSDEECSSDETVEEIKEWGVCPTYALEYRNYIKQMELALQPPPNSIGMGVGCSYGSTDEKEAVPRKRQYHSFIELEEMGSSEN